MPRALASARWEKRWLQISRVLFGESVGSRQPCRLAQSLAASPAGNKGWLQQMLAQSLATCPRAGQIMLMF